MILLEQSAEFVKYVVIFGLGVLCGLALLASMGRAAFGLLRPTLRFVRWLMTPVRLFLKIVGIKTLANTRAARAAAALGIHQGTKIQSVLKSPQEGGQTVDLSAEDRMLATRGTLFKWLQIPPDYIPSELFEPITDEITEMYFEEAKSFLTRSVELDVDQNNFYEDEEGGIVASLFLNTDRRCFYALDRLRRVINGNAFRFIAQMSIGVVLSATGIVYTIPYAISTPHSGIPIFISILLFIILLTFFLQSQYAYGQRTNMNEFSELLTRYLSRINNRFREASAKASRVIQGDERDSTVLSKNAQRWLQIMIWLGFRPFFIEAFIRNVNFQMRRNLGYYMAGAVVWFVLLIPIIFWLVLWAGLMESITPQTGALIVGAYVFFVAPLTLWQLNRKVVLEQLSRKNWLGFDDLKLAKEISEVIGKYAEEIALWRGRFHQ